MVTSYHEHHKIQDESIRDMLDRHNRKLESTMVDIKLYQTEIEETHESIQIMKQGMQDMVKEMKSSKGQHVSQETIRDSSRKHQEEVNIMYEQEYGEFKTRELRNVSVKVPKKSMQLPSTGVEDKFHTSQIITDQKKLQN